MMAAPHWRGWRWLWPWARDWRTPEEREPALRLVRQMQERTRAELRTIQKLNDEADLYQRREREERGRRGPD